MYYVAIRASRSVSVQHHKSLVVGNIVTAVNLLSNQSSSQINLASYRVLHLRPVHDQLAAAVAAVIDPSQSR